MQDNFLIAVLIGYLFIGAALVVTLKGVRGVMACIVIGWIFLPPGRGVNLPGLPQFTKEFSVSYALMIGVLISDATRLASFKPRLLDIPMLVWILVPLPSSITNNLGAYDGFSEVYFNLFIFGVPYLLGRVYIRNPDDVKTVAIWFILAGLIAAPMALWESRMSPHLNESVYGYRVAKFHMAKRMGGYRPMLFMRHGLEVGLWMATSSAVAIWLWITTRKQIRILNWPLPNMSTIVVVATLLSRSLGALILLIGTTGAAFFVRTTGLRIVLIALILTPSIYLTIRISNVWAPDQLTAIIRAFDPDRADSLESRLGQELNIAQHALEKPVFGWGGHDRYRPQDEYGHATPVDGMTTISFGKRGLVGLSALLAMTALPSLLMVLRIKGRSITSSIWAPAVGIMLALCIYSMDMMFNAFYTPLHIVGIGVIASVAVQTKNWQYAINRHQQMKTYTSAPNASKNRSVNPNSSNNSKDERS